MCCKALSKLFSIQIPFDRLNVGLDEWLVPYLALRCAGRVTTVLHDVIVESSAEGVKRALGVLRHWRFDAGGVFSNDERGLLVYDCALRYEVRTELCDP